MGKEQREQSGQALGGKAGPTEMCSTWSLGQRKEMKSCPHSQHLPAREAGQQPSWSSHFPAESLGNVGFWAAPLKIWLCVSRMGPGNLLFFFFF